MSPPERDWSALKGERYREPRVKTILPIVEVHLTKDPKEKGVQTPVPAGCDTQILLEKSVCAARLNRATRLTIVPGPSAAGPGAFLM
jgi:hypothetical protein